MSDKDYDEFIAGFQKLIEIGQRRVQKYIDKIKKNDIIINKLEVSFNDE